MGKVYLHLTGGNEGIHLFSSLLCWCHEVSVILLSWSWPIFFSPGPSDTTTRTERLLGRKPKIASDAADWRTLNQLVVSYGCPSARGWMSLAEWLTLADCGQAVAFAAAVHSACQARYEPEWGLRWLARGSHVASRSFVSLCKTLLYPCFHTLQSLFIFLIM